jgi:hypothetical protein
MLLLLFALPSKWLWHFGAMMGVAAIAAALETRRFQVEGSRFPSVQARALIALGVVAVAIAWSWGPQESWTVLDVRSVDWTLGLGGGAPLVLLAVSLPFLALLFDVLTSRSRGVQRRNAALRVVGIAVPLVVIPMAVFTGGVLMADAARSSWTLTRQNVDVLRSRQGCGLADVVLTPRADSMTALPLTTQSSPPLGTGTPAAPVAGVARYSLAPDAHGSASSPWYRLPRHERVGIFIAGAPAEGDRLVMESRRKRDGMESAYRTRALFSDPFPNPSGVSPWRFVTSRAIREAASGASFVRVTLRSTSSLSSPIVVTSPVSYSPQTLASLISESGTTALVSPGLATYLPCARLPEIRDGVAGVPQYLVFPTADLGADNGVLVGYRSSPFQGVADLYDIVRLSIGDTRNAPRVLVWKVDDRIAGAAIARPVETRTTS